MSARRFTQVTRTSTIGIDNILEGEVKGKGQLNDSELDPLSLFALSNTFDLAKSEVASPDKPSGLLEDTLASSDKYDLLNDYFGDKSDKSQTIINDASRDKDGRADLNRESSGDITPPNRTSVKMVGSTSPGKPSASYKSNTIISNNNQESRIRSDNNDLNKNNNNNNSISISSNDDIPFRYLTGEHKVMNLPDSFLLINQTSHIPGIIFMTNYRLAFVPIAKANELKSIYHNNPSMYSWLITPLSSIDRIEKEKRPKEYNQNNGVSIIISCKDFRQLRFTVRSKGSSGSNTSSATEYEIEKALGLMAAYVFPNNMKYLFAFSHSFSVEEELITGNDGGNGITQPSMSVIKSISPKYDSMLEFSRMGALDSSSWRITNANSDYKLCQTYPKLLLVPKQLSDDELFVISTFRSGHRLPILCWVCRHTNASMWRSSQPKAGVSGSCLQDEKMLDLIANSCLQSNRINNSSSTPCLFIVDLRSRTSAMANRAAGAGYESQNNYPTCRLDFYNIPNIHVMRDSLKSLQAILLNPTSSPNDSVNFTKQVEDTQWLTYVRLVLKASHETASIILTGSPVLVHCSHGWDRTAQVCTLAQILLDPFYRTIQGFQILVEKEWNSFGHPFQMRSAHTQDKSSRQEDQVSPIFLQFLDCVYQLVRQNPHWFEFNTRFILTIADHVYSGRFGNFLFSSDYDRDMYSSHELCADLWTYLEFNRNMFINPLYYQISNNGRDSGKRDPLLPPLPQLLRNVVLWSDYYFRWSSVQSLPTTPPEISKYMYNEDTLIPIWNQYYETQSYSPSIMISIEGKRIKYVLNSHDSFVCCHITTDDFWEGTAWAMKL
eukprot:gene8525-11523_t